MSKKDRDGHVYRESGYWWFRNQFTGQLEGTFATRKQARERRKEVYAAEREKKVEQQQAA